METYAKANALPDEGGSPSVSWNSEEWFRQCTIMEQQLERTRGITKATNDDVGEIHEHNTQNSPRVDTVERKRARGDERQDVIDGRAMVGVDKKRLSLQSSSSWEAEAMRAMLEIEEVRCKVVPLDDVVDDVALADNVVVAAGTPFFGQRRSLSSWELPPSLVEV
jgi:hypothetical protein